jgi:hypothetical protein
MQRIIGSIEIERDLRRRPRVRVKKQIDEQRLDRRCIGGEASIARRLGTAQFKTVERALARQRRAVGASCFELTSGGFSTCSAGGTLVAITGSWRSSS